jgi:hypothetical protein
MVDGSLQVVRQYRAPSSAPGDGQRTAGFRQESDGARARCSPGRRVALLPAGSGPEAAAHAALEIHAQNRPEQPTSVITATLSVPEIGPWLARAYGEITGVLADQGRESADRRTPGTTRERSF